MGYMGLGVYVQSLGDVLSPPLPIELGYEIKGVFLENPLLTTAVPHNGCLGSITDEGRDKLR